MTDFYITQWITEASARTYQLGKAAPGLNPFSFDEVVGTSIFINQTYNGEEPVNIDKLAGRYPGTWTVPVCNTSTWGAAWNWDFINKTQPILEYERQGKQLMPACAVGVLHFLHPLWYSSNRGADVYGVGCCR